MAANPLGAHRVGICKPTAWPSDMRSAMMSLGRAGGEVITILDRHAQNRDRIGSDKSLYQNQ
jgi:hypothetical protein